ncbi:MAG TPA: hypothetical protein VIT89_03475 [Solirubrobacterales bacterium]
MSLRELLDLCQDTHSDDWVLMPGNRPATAMLAGVFDPGMKDEARTRTLDGHSIAVYEPDPKLSMVWPVPEEPAAERSDRFERGLPDWAEEDSEEFKSARVAYTVILLGGAPVWQEAVWYLDWGSGIGGYVPYIEPVFSDEYEEHERPRTGWQASLWAVKLARLMNTFEGTHHWHPHDPTMRLVPEPNKMHPIDARRAGH